MEEQARLASPFRDRIDAGRALYENFEPTEDAEVESILREFTPRAAATAGR